MSWHILCLNLLSKFDGSTIFHHFSRDFILLGFQNFHMILYSADEKWFSLTSNSCRKFRFKVVCWTDPLASSFITARYFWCRKNKNNRELHKVWIITESSDLFQELICNLLCDLSLHFFLSWKYIFLGIFLFVIQIEGRVA